MAQKVVLQSRRKPREQTSISQADPDIRRAPYPYIYPYTRIPPAGERDEGQPQKKLSCWRQAGKPAKLSEPSRAPTLQE
eukprot:13791620-Heterocapsa_arctica.AAC.1